MDWLVDQLNWVVPVAITLLYLFSQVFNKQEAEAPPPTETDLEARRIQEEIRRKIIARQRGEEAPPPLPREQEAHDHSRRPVIFPRRQEEAQEPRRFEAPAEASPRAERAPAPQVRNYAEELAAQRQRLRETEQVREAAVQRTASRPTAPRSREPLTAQTGDRGLREQLQGDLETASSLRRAFVLKEIVDRPVSLRDRPDTFSNWG